jgi:hypothetical protein
MGILSGDDGGEVMGTWSDGGGGGEDHAKQKKRRDKE